MSPDGLVLVDKPSGPTSHDVVGQMRRTFGTRKVGHAGTLDPMATGMLVVGVGRATRLLGYLAGSDKEYLATIRLGQSTTTDDAQGESVSRADAAGLAPAALHEALRALRGPIQQRPSAVSAIKVDGKRAYARVRAGENVQLEPRAVVVHDLEVLGTRAHDTVLDVQVRVECSTGTYIRALARDLGAALGVGGHLTSLRRTRSGPFRDMRSLEDIAANPSVIALADAVRAAFPVVELAADEAVRARHGVAVPAPARCPGGVIGVLDDRGEVISLCRVRESTLRPEAVFVGG